jgi:hypothetical protein
MQDIELYYATLALYKESKKAKAYTKRPLKALGKAN